MATRKDKSQESVVAVIDWLTTIPHLLCFGLRWKMHGPFAEFMAQLRLD
jgi:hypothetical protein